MLKNKAKQDFIYILLAIIIVFGIYMISRIVGFYNKPAEYSIARNGRIISYEQDMAYVIRDEELLDTTEFANNNMQIIISDNNRVAKGNAIASFTLNDSSELREQVKEIDNQIQELVKEVQPGYSQELKTIENNLANEIYNYIKYSNDIEILNNRKKSIDDLLEKKVKVISTFSEKGSDLDKLVKEREEVEKEINKNKNKIKADRAGLVSYRVDGYESLLSPYNFSSITPEMLNKIKFSTDQAIPVSTNQIKIINNFYAYLIVVSKSDESKNLMLNDTVKFTISNNLNSLSKGTVDYIINDNGTRYIFIKTTDNVEKLSQYRKLNVNIVWWNYQGLKIPDESLFEDEIKDYFGNTIAKISAVNVQGNTGYTKKVWVNVEKQAGGFSIVENYTDEELKELGLSDELIDERSKLNLYDKVLINQ